MLSHMVTRAPGRVLLTGTALLTVAGSLAEAAAAVRAGADLVDLGGAGPAIIAAFRRAHPRTAVCSDAGPGDLVRHPQAALAAGVLLLCPDAAAASGSGLPPGRLVVEVAPGGLPAVTAAGWAALVDADAAADRARQVAGGARERQAGSRQRAAGSRTDDQQTGGGEAAHDQQAAAAGIVAIAALSCWLGATVVRTRHVRPVRRALDMSASIRGDRPPARAVRGLA